MFFLLPFLGWLSLIVYLIPIITLNNIIDVFCQIDNGFTWLFSGLTALATYFLTKEVWNSGAGLFAACFIAIGWIFIKLTVIFT